MKFIHIADVHIGATPDRGRVWGDARIDEISETFSNIIDVCNEQNVDLLLIAGDLFHTQPTLAQLNNLDYTFSKLDKTKVVMIAGNHDYIESGAYWHNYTFKSNTILFPRDKAVSIYLADIKTGITGYSYGRQVYTERILERLKPGREMAYNILLGHGGDREHMPFSKERLASTGFDYYALGHIHKPGHILKNKMAFSGSLEPLDYTETGKHGYILGEVDAANTTRITFVPFAKRSYINLSLEVNPDYSNAEIMDIIKNNIEEAGTQNIYRILIKGIINNDLELNLSSLTRHYNINEIIDRTSYNYNVSDLLAGNENNLLGRFISTLSDEESTEDEEIRMKAMKYGIEALIGIGDK